MPRGGPRPGSGRPRGSANRKTREIVDRAAANGSVMPLSYLLAILNSDASTRAQKIRAAEVACAYCHPRLNAVQVGGNLVTGGGGGGGEAKSITQILAVPHGATLGADGTITIEGDRVTELPTVVPFNGTPALTDQSEAPAPSERTLERLEVVEVDVSNVTRLHRREDEPDEPPSGAA
jgi:hypothetical protein